jgi:sugar lactone lactonase YvrE
LALCCVLAACRFDGHGITAPNDAPSGREATGDVGPSPLDGPRQDGDGPRQDGDGPRQDGDGQVRDARLVDLKPPVDVKVLDLKPPVDVKAQDTWPCPANECWIGGSCRTAGSTETGNGCHTCDPARSTTQWSASFQAACWKVIPGAGSTQGYANGSAAQAQFSAVAGVALGAAGLYIADMDNRRIRLLSLSTGQVSTVAGSGSSGCLDGAALSAQFISPHGIAIDSAGTLYIVDISCHKIRSLASGQVQTVAGTGIVGFKDGPAASAQFNDLRGVAVDAAGAVYAAEKTGQRIRKLAGGQVSTLAGNGTLGYVDGPAASAQLNNAHGVAVAPTGAVFFVEEAGNRVRSVVNGTVSTVAGDGTAGFKDGPAATARFNLPRGVAVDSFGKIYVADSFNYRVRVISNGVVSTVAGDGTQGIVDGVGTSARFYEPASLAVSADGKTIYVGDEYGHRVRVISVAP